MFHNAFHAPSRYKFDPFMPSYEKKKSIAQCNIITTNSYKLTDKIRFELPLLLGAVQTSSVAVRNGGKYQGR